jgi:hypothetical protein
MNFPSYSISVGMRGFHILRIYCTFLLSHFLLGVTNEPYSASFQVFTTEALEVPVATNVSFATRITFCSGFLDFTS